MIDFILAKYLVIIDCMTGVPPFIGYILLFVIFIIIITSPTNWLIKSYMKKLNFDEINTSNESNNSNNSNIHDDKTGRKIGSIERILYFIGVLFNNWSLITLIIAIKSIGRYSKLNEKVFAEKFLIGTLLSLLISIILGYIFLGITSYYKLDVFVKELYDTIQKISLY